MISSPPCVAHVFIRRATVDDAITVGDVFLASRRELLPFALLRHDEADVRRWIAQVLIPDGGVFVAVRDEAIVAMMALAQDADGIGWIDQLYVAPAFVGSGIGTRMLAFAMSHLLPPIRLYTFQQNVRARRFYERHGFVPIAVGDGSGNEEGVPDVLYEWSRDNLRASGVHRP